MNLLKSLDTQTLKNMLAEITDVPTLGFVRAELLKRGELDSNKTEDYIINGNKLIAEFMDNGDVGAGKAIYAVWLNNKAVGYFPVDKLKYHSSWDWLMPVIKKLQSISAEPDELDHLHDVIWFGNIESAFTEVIDCINTIERI